MDTRWRELRMGLRTVLARPAFTAVAMTVLALGIGVNAAVFSTLYAVVLRPLRSE
jgi:putative ABC transport system permease protein